MTIYTVPITKAKANIAVDSGDLSDEVCAAIFQEGLKSFLNKNMSKIVLKDLDDEELEEARAAALAKGEENLENLKAGAIKKRKATKESREVTTEARRLAREAVRAAFREAGKKITGIKSAVITKAADELIAENPEYLEKARENVAKMKARDTIKVAPKEGTSLASLIAQAETAKPKVAPVRKKKEPSAGEMASAAKGKGRGSRPSAN